MAINIIESHNINLNPGYPVPVYHSSQYDVGRKLRLYIYNMYEEYFFSVDDIITVIITRPDKVQVTKSVTNPGTSSRSITFTTTQNMTSVPGRCNGEIRLEVENGPRPNTIIGTCNFILDVEPDPLYGSIPGDSPINTLDKQIEEITNQLIGE